MAVGGQDDAHGGRHLQRFPDPGGHSPADQFGTIAHGARLGIALLPAERRRALAIAFAQLLAGVGEVLVLIAIRVALQAQFKRIEIERHGEFVHRAFERVDARRRARRAHVGRGGDIEAHELVLELRVGALVKKATPSGIVARELFELGGDRDRLVRHAVERPIRLGAERQTLDRRRTIAQAVHLLTREDEANRPLQRYGAEHRQHHLILRSQTGAETAAHERPHDAHVVRLLVEHAAQIALHVLHALRLVVDRQLAARVPHRGRRIELHRIVVLGGNEVFRLMAYVGRRNGACRIAARLFRLLDDEGRIALRLDIRDAGLVLILDLHTRGREARRIPVFGKHECDRLPAEQDLVVIERTKRRALLGRDIVLPGLVRIGQRRAVLMRQNVDDAFDLQSVARVDPHDAALRNGRFDNEAIDEVRHVELARILRCAGHLGAPVDA